LNPEPPEGFAAETGDRTVVLAEIEVLKAWQGAASVVPLHHEFLRSQHEERATLAANPAATARHSIYEGWGWIRVGIVPGRPVAHYKEYVRSARRFARADRLLVGGSVSDRVRPCPMRRVY
jgi:hypothetical protein